MARLVEAVEVSAQVVDAAAGRDGGALVLRARPVAAGVEGKDLREGGLGAADGPAHVCADFGHFVAEKGDVWGAGEDGGGEGCEEDEAGFAGHCSDWLIGQMIQ